MGENVGRGAGRARGTRAPAARFAAAPACPQTRRRPPPKTHVAVLQRKLLVDVQLSVQERLLRGLAGGTKQRRIVRRGRPWRMHLCTQAMARQLNCAPALPSASSHCAPRPSPAHLLLDLVVLLDLLAGRGALHGLRACIGFGGRQVGCKGRQTALAPRAWARSCARAGRGSKQVEAQGKRPRWRAARLPALTARWRLICSCGSVSMRDMRLATRFWGAGGEGWVSGRGWRGQG
jgi:hypothetical protein